MGSATRLVSLLAVLLAGAAASAYPAIGPLAETGTIARRMSSRAAALGRKVPPARAEHLTELLQIDSERLSQLAASYPELAVRVPAIREEMDRLTDAVADGDSEARRQSAKDLRAALRHYQKWVGVSVGRGAG
jgi:hypothetical protein